MSSISSSLHCTVQPVASQFERMIRIADDAPGGPAGPVSPLGPGGPAGPGSPFAPGGDCPQPASHIAKVTSMIAWYICMDFHAHGAPYPLQAKIMPWDPSAA